MFTGIIHHSGMIKKIATIKGGKKFTIESEFEDLTLGESIAVNGICLTVTHIDKQTFECELSPETLHSTCAEQLGEGDAVNLERAMRLSDRLGGHLVTGHVDGQIEVMSVEPEGEFTKVTLTKTGTGLDRCLMPKGSVTLNGVSLTVNHVSRNEFSVMLIPQTKNITTLKDIAIGDWMNIEYDWMAKTVNHQLRLMNVGQRTHQAQTGGQERRRHNNGHHHNGPSANRQGRHTHQGGFRQASGQSANSRPDYGQDFGNRQPYKNGNVAGQDSHYGNDTAWHDAPNGNMTYYSHGQEDQDARGGTSYLRKRRTPYRKPSANPELADQPAFVSHDEIAPKLESAYMYDTEE